MNARIIVALCLAISSSVTVAQSYPVRPVRLLVPNPPGGATDANARIIAKEVENGLGQPLVIGLIVLTIVVIAYPFLREKPAWAGGGE